MSNTPHGLLEEFPADREKMHALKISDAHFARLMADYDAVNDKVHRAETRIEPVAEVEEDGLRRKRAWLKDEIARALRA